MIQVTAPDLDRIVQNALLFVNDKSVFLDEVFLTVLEGRVYVYSCDDYVGFTDSCEVTDGSEEIDIYLTIADAKKLGEWVKKDKKVVHKYDVKLHKKFTGVRFECPDAPEGDDQELFLPFASKIPEQFLFLSAATSREALTSTIPSFFALRPERVSRLARIKADKESPLDFRGITMNGKDILQFRIGYTATGCIMPVDRSKVDDGFLWD